MVSTLPQAQGPLAVSGEDPGLGVLAETTAPHCLVIRSCPLASGNSKCVGKAEENTSEAPEDLKCDAPTHENKRGDSGSQPPAQARRHEETSTGSQTLGSHVLY